MFKTGDKVKVINPISYKFGSIGIITSLVKYGGYFVEIDNKKYHYLENEIERIDDMNISERISEVIKENQNLKQQLSEQNIKLNMIQADLKRELRDKQGVSDEEFREAFIFYSKNNSQICCAVWGSGCVNGLVYLFDNLPISEFVSKYKEYKDKQNEIKAGDEVYCLDHNYKSIVTSVEDGVAVMITNNGKCSICNTEELHKTGKRYDIESILNGLKEGD